MDTFSTAPTEYAPKRKVLDFAKPKWHTKLGEFNDPDIMCWINNLYQSRAFPTREAFNKAYDDARDRGVMPSTAVTWHNNTMILKKEDFEDFEEEFKGSKLVEKMQKAFDAGKAIFVY
jgi:hypothetical protein